MIRPFNEDEYQLTRKDKISIAEFAVQTGLKLDENSKLYKLGKELGIL